MTPRARPDPVVLAFAIVMLGIAGIAAALLGAWFGAAVAILLTVRCALDLQPVARLSPSRTLSRAQENAIWSFALALLVLLQFVATGDQVMLLLLIALVWHSLSITARGMATIGVLFAGFLLVELAISDGARQRVALVCLAAQPIYWLYVVRLIRRDGGSRRPRGRDQPI